MLFGLGDLVGVEVGGQLADGAEDLLGLLDLQQPGRQR